MDNSEILSKYDITKELGKGAQGIVYLGVDKITNEKVAIKKMLILTPDTVDLEKDMNHALIEIDLLKSVSAEPNCNIYISCYIDHIIDWENGIIYLIMEYIDGPSLDKYVEPLYYPSGDPRGEYSSHGNSLYLLENSQTLNEIIYNTTKAMVTALQDIHKQGVLHRDIKPQNIVVELKSGIPKLVDFGMACQALREDSIPCTIPNSIPSKKSMCCLGGGGTLAYMAPERILYGARYPQSDIWSLGAAMYNILTKKIIWGGKSLEESTVKSVTTAINEDEPDIVRTGIILLDNLINGMTNKDVSGRLTSDKILNMLRHI